MNIVGVLLSSVTTCMYVGHGIAMGASAREAGNHTQLCVLPARGRMEEG